MRASAGIKRDVRVFAEGIEISTRNHLNLIAGTGATIAVSDNAVDDAVDVTIGATGEEGIAAAWFLSS